MKTHIENPLLVVENAVRKGLNQIGFAFEFVARRTPRVLMAALALSAVLVPAATAGPDRPAGAQPTAEQPTNDIDCHDLLASLGRNDLIGPTVVASQPDYIGGPDILTIDPASCHPANQ